MAEPADFLRLILSFPGRAPDELALEEYLLDKAKPALLIYSFSKPVLVLGLAQKLEDINLEYCRKKEIPVFRRSTGGTGVLHHRDLALSLVLPHSHPWSGSILGLYRKFLDILAPVLDGNSGRVQRPTATSSSGIRSRSPICFEDQLAETLLLEGRKIVGCAQHRRRRAVLIHAAISLHPDVENYAGVFGVTEEHVRRLIADAPVGEDPVEPASHLAQAFSVALGLELTPTAFPHIGEAWTSRYQTRRWAPLIQDNR